jgi:hypothetical protein
LGREEEVEATELEEDLDVAGYEDASDGGRQDSTDEEDEEEEGTMMVQRCTMRRGWGDRSASGSASSC